MKLVKTISTLSFLAATLMITCELTASEQRQASPDYKYLVLRGGKIATVDKEFSIQEAVVAQGDKIIYVGSNEGAEAYAGENSKVIELDGKLVLPGFIDTHGHMHDLGEKLTHLDITGTNSFAEIIRIVAEKLKTVEPGEWIVGERWDQSDWSDKRFPYHDRLSEITPNNPVFLYRIDGHSALLNREALEIANITRETVDPYGGVIVRKRNGEPTGVLINRAMTMVEKLLPENTEEQYRQKFFKAVDSSLAVGLTGWHEPSINSQKIDFYKELIDQKLLKMRVYAILGEQDVLFFEKDMGEYFTRNRIRNYGNHFLSAQCVKLFLDGSLGSRGAAFFEPYADDPNNIGLLRVDTEYVYQVAKAALESGIGVSAHCIGIRATSLCLDAYERALAEHPTKDHRFRIEHAEIVRDQDVARFARLGVIPSMRPAHCIIDMKFVEDRVGPKRAQGAFAWRKFLDAGCIIACGSDFPVVSNNPLFGIYAATARQDIDGNPEGGWFGDQKMTIEEAVRGYTIWAAYAAFQEDLLGSIEVGKLADLVVLDQDILKSEPRELLNTQVLYTIVGGQIAYENKN
ncbi:MAG: amidohydrolase [Planctomycetes bacterium]|nr:amidohydrolase [Planctomycetota bacterium]